MVFNKILNMIPFIGGGKKKSESALKEKGETDADPTANPESESDTPIDEENPDEENPDGENPDGEDPDGDGEPEPSEPVYVQDGKCPTEQCEPEESCKEKPFEWGSWDTGGLKLLGMIFISLLIYYICVLLEAKHLGSIQKPMVHDKCPGQLPKFFEIGRMAQIKTSVWLPNKKPVKITGLCLITIIFMLWYYNDVVSKKEEGDKCLQRKISSRKKCNDILKNKNMCLITNNFRGTVLDIIQYGRNVPADLEIRECNTESTEPITESCMCGEIFCNKNESEKSFEKKELETFIDTWMGDFPEIIERWIESTIMSEREEIEDELCGEYYKKIYGNVTHSRCDGGENNVSVRSSFHGDKIGFKEQIFGKYCYKENEKFNADVSENIRI